MKGELRLGIYVDFDGDHGSWVYKHWYVRHLFLHKSADTAHRKCMSEYDLENLQMHFKQEMFDINTLSKECSDAVYKTLETGTLVEPPEPPEQAPATKAKKPRAKKKKAFDDDDGDSDVEAPKPKRPRKKRVVEEQMDSSEVEYVPQKTKSRQLVAEPEETETMKNIQALAEKMREAAAK